MQTNLLWSGSEYYSLENCLVDTIESGSEITSVIVGTYQGTIYRVDYRVKTTKIGMCYLLKYKLSTPTTDINSRLKPSELVNGYLTAGLMIDLTDVSMWISG